MEMGLGCGGGLGIFVWMGRVGGGLKLGGFGMVDVVVIEQVWKLWNLER
jgi:hypothetical protein